MILEKVYDELLGMIEDLKKKVAGLSGGSVVTITPTLQSGEKLADYSIDGTDGAIYAPSVPEIKSKIFSVATAASQYVSPFTNYGGVDISEDVATVDQVVSMVVQSGTSTELAFCKYASGYLNVYSNTAKTFDIKVYYYEAAPTRTTKKKK